MSVTDVQPLHEQATGEMLADGTRLYTLPWRVLTNDNLDGMRTVLEAADLPIIGSTYDYGNDSDPAAICISKGAGRLGDSRTAWIVTTKYTNNLGPGTVATVSPPDPNPLLRPATYQRGGVMFTKPLTRDRNGNLVRNSAGDPYVDRPDVNDAHYQIQITKNVLSYSDEEAMQYMCAVNSDVFLDAAARKWQVIGFSGDGPLIENGYVYWTKVVTVIYSFEGWDIELLEQGYRVIRGSQAYETLENGTKITDPVLLDENGEEVGPTGAPTYRTWEYYRELPFAALGL